jgi:hypothetical protein
MNAIYNTSNGCTSTTTRTSKCDRVVDGGAQFSFIDDLGCRALVIVRVWLDDSYL